MNVRTAIFLLALTAFSCSTEDTVPVVPPRYTLQIDFQNGFSSDSVLVLMDGKLLAYGTFTSDTTGFAGRQTYSLLAAQHTLSIYGISSRIKNRFDSSFVQPSSTLYLGIGYASLSNWVIRFSQQPFVYQPVF